jgi:hypothetical protein
MKRLWLVRLGKSRDGEAAALETSKLEIGFALDTLAGAKDREACVSAWKSDPVFEWAP